MTKSKSAQLRFVYLWMGIILAFYIVLRFIPIFNSFRLSFFKWDLINPVKPFIGLDNYRRLAGDEDFIVAFRNTLIFSVFLVSLSLVLSLAFALTLQKKFRGKGIFETLYFLPYVIAVVPAALSWKFIYDPTNGALNHILGLVGVPKQAWLINDRLALGSIIAMSIWQRVGYNMVIFTVGLGEIPADYYEAARVDGAGALRIFRKITLPLLTPVTLYLLIMNTIEAFNIFTPVYVMTTGTQSAPGSVTKVLVMEIYQNAFRFFKMGYASAQSVCLFAIVLVVSLLQFSTFGRRER